MKDDLKPGQMFRHIKRGTEYEIIGVGELQMSHDSLVDGSSMVLYRGANGQLWCREEGEFLDGRFERVNRPEPVADEALVSDHVVEVTDADRGAAASIAVLPEMRELILAGKADHHAEPWAAHRMAAFQDGYETGQGEESPYCPVCGSCGDEGCGCLKNCMYATAPAPDQAQPIDDEALVEKLVGWQPIETAPHGRPVLLAWQDWRDGKWIMDVGPASTGESNEVASSISHHGSATQWMPLPAAPTLSEHAGEGGD